MRRRSVVAAAALIAAFALVGLPAPADSRLPAPVAGVAPAAFTTVVIPADAPALEARGRSGDAGDVIEVLAATRPADPVADEPFVEAGDAPTAPGRRPVVDQPDAKRGSAWREPRRVLTGWASFYDHGTTAMRLPRGTVVRICGDGGCIERTVTDYGPSKGGGRIADLYRPDFFKVCGCASWSGTTKVTVSVY
jgi:hypothetical protein